MDAPIKAQEPTEWAGGDCPAPPRSLVLVRCAFETDFDFDQMPRRAEAWASNWRRDAWLPNELSITHYLPVSG